MALRQMKYLSCVAAMLVGGLGAAAPSEPQGRHVVHPGESIQRAVNQARPGDTVFIRPGRYRGSVLITKPRLRLIGAGRRTVIEPSGKRAGNACGRSGNGICILGGQGRPLRDVTLHGLTVQGFKKSGIWASRTDRLAVHDVTSRNNGLWGIAQERSTRAAFRENTVTGNRESGIFLANVVKEEGGATDNRGATILGNRIFRNRIGITLRRVRNLTVAHNDIGGNCGGIFIVGDESRPRAGALTVRDNSIVKNNRRCAANGRLPVIQGVGVVLTGTERALVRHNLIRENRGTSPFSGGVVLFPSFVKSLNERNVISDNIMLRNKPADLANRDRAGQYNRFLRNVCRTSQPAKLCPRTHRAHPSSTGE
ncbi:right-handed parallel beta-helix repeat-containing protein [Streptomyces kronopolitis]|uniref:right-handed parallel beta-helix repeat-containing protein n=1 Tax=Streptomyces kronopolitis TaxID=1612435 RepID=UPI003442C820